MDDTLITIPGVTAHHILGHSSVTLGAGDLNLLPASGVPKAELMLTVGSAGFSLHHDTTFGTLEGDPRTYVFSPEIEGVTGGFVKITLPEGVKEDGSRLSSLQTKFEQVLIAHGLLQPGVNEPGMGGGSGTRHATHHAKNPIALGPEEPLVKIPGCVAAQILGEDVTILSEGMLSLVVMPQSKQEDGPVLTLIVDKSAFPLYKSTLFGTLANDSRTYVFAPEVEGANKSLVAIVLPDAEAPHEASLDLASLQNQLELILIDHGLLKDGFEAAADEIARSFREGGALTAERVRRARADYLDMHAPTVSPAEFSRAAHNVAQGAEWGTQILADVAHGVGGTVLSAAEAAGAWIGSTFVPTVTEPETTVELKAAVRGTKDIAQGVGAGVGEVTDALKDAGGSVIENDFGKEARDVVGNAGQSVGNIMVVTAGAATVVRRGPLLAAGVVGAMSNENKAERKQIEEPVKEDQTREQEQKDEAAISS